MTERIQRTAVLSSRSAKEHRQADIKKLNLVCHNRTLFRMSLTMILIKEEALLPIFEENVMPAGQMSTKLLSSVQVQMKASVKELGKNNHYRWILALIRNPK